METVRLEAVSYRYPGQDGWALQDIHLRAEEGEMLVVMGPSGAGKSTLAKCLNRSIPTFHSGELRGQVSVAGRLLTGETVGDLAGVVGLVSQDFESQLFATNVREEILFGVEQIGLAATAIDARIDAALASVGLSGFEHRDPATLSGGEKQRLAIAAILALQPQVLVFDEPTTDLDPRGRQEIFAVLAAMRRQGLTIVVIEHEIAAAEHADRLIVLDQGRIVADEPAADLLRQPQRLEDHGIRPLEAAKLGAELGLTPIPISTAGLLEQVERARGVRDRPCPTVPVRAGAQGLSGTSGDGIDREAAIVSLEGVQFAYQTDRPVLRGVDLEIGAAERIVMIGQNGSGKTTLVKHLNGLLKPTGGSVSIRPAGGAGAVATTHCPIQRLASTVGYVFQNPDHQIFAATVAEEVGFGPRNLELGEIEVGRRVDWALASVGFDGSLTDDPFVLPKGQRQRLAVASVLALRPRLLVLDEPTTGLDYREQQTMLRLLASLQGEGMSVLIITHTPWIASEYAERGILIADGRIAFDGSLADLLCADELLEQAHFILPDARRIAGALGLDATTVTQLASQLRQDDRWL